MKTLQATSAPEAAAAWWTYTLYDVRHLYNESISHDICLGDLKPLYYHHLNAFQRRLETDLRRELCGTGMQTVSVIDGRPSTLLSQAATEAGVSLMYLQLLGQSIMCVSRDKVEVNEGEMGLFREVWRRERVPQGQVPLEAA